MPRLMARAYEPGSPTGCTAPAAVTIQTTSVEASTSPETSHVMSAVHLRLIAASRRPACGLQTGCCARPDAVVRSGDSADDLDEFVDAVPLSAGELDQFARPEDHGAALRCGGDGDPAAAAELE